jgi:hypothetical protein
MIGLYRRAFDSNWLYREYYQTMKMILYALVLSFSVAKNIDHSKLEGRAHVSTELYRTMIQITKYVQSGLFIRQSSKSVRKEENNDTPKKNRF